MRVCRLWFGLGIGFPYRDTGKVWVLFIPLRGHSASIVGYPTAEREQFVRRFRRPGEKPCVDPAYSSIGAIGLTCLSGLPSGAATARNPARGWPGVWTLVSSNTVDPDGRRTPTLGTKPTGNLIFTEDGHFLWLLLSADLPKFASNNRATGTPEENAAVVRGSIAVYGTYAVTDKDLMFTIEQSTFPNWRESQQKRTIKVLTSGELKWTRSYRLNRRRRRTRL